MSDLLIKGMKMPIGCAFCKIKKRNGKKTICPFCNGEWDICDPMSADHRLGSCPLIEVLPHGRLIDADALAAQCDDPYWCVWLNEIEDAPTVIEAEE